MSPRSVTGDENVRASRRRRARLERAVLNAARQADECARSQMSLFADGQHPCQRCDDRLFDAQEALAKFDLEQMEAGYPVYRGAPEGL